VININKWVGELRRHFLSTGFAYLVVIVLLNISTISGQLRAYPRLPFTHYGTVQDTKEHVELGQSVNRELGGGQRHEYVIAVLPGQYVNLAVSQLGIDVVLTIRGTGGERVIEADKANGTRGRERLSLILEPAGSYDLEISAREEKAALGRYTLEITEVRPATRADEARWSAERELDLAKQLLRQNTGAALTQAIEKYLDSLRLWQAANDVEGQAITLLSLANAYFTAGSFRQSLDKYQEAEALFQATADPVNKALAVLYIGMCKLALGDTEGAQTQYNQALSLFTELDDQKFLAFALNELGRVCYLQGQGFEARDYFLRAIEIRKVVDDRKGLAFSLNVVGRVLFYHFGEDENAVTYYKQALELQQEIKDYRRAAQTLDDIGRIHFASGRDQEALDHYSRALKIQRDTGDIIGEAETLSYIGMIYVASGRSAEAVSDYYQTALKIQQDAGDRIGEARTFHNMGVAYFSSGNNEKALEALNSALKIWRNVLFRTAEAETHYAIARVEAKRGNLAEARRQIEEALPVVESLRTKIANQYLRISYFASVQSYYELYVDVLMQLHQQSRADGLDNLALSINERALGRSLLDTLIEAQTDISRGVDPELLNRQRNLQRQLSLLSQQRMLREGQNSEEAAAAKGRLASLLMDYQNVEEEILKKSPAYAALTQPANLSVAEIQRKLLDQGTVLLEYALGEERSYLWVITPTHTDSYELSKRTDIEKAAKHLRETLTARNQVVAGERVAQTRARVESADAEAVKKAARLGELLALDKVSAIHEAKRLVIVSDGELQYIPFSMLPISRPPELKEQEATKTEPKRRVGPVPLVTSYEVVRLPSVAVLAELRRKQPTQSKSSEYSVIVVADPVFDKNDERVRPLVAGTNGNSKTNAVTNTAVSSQPAGDASPLVAATRPANITDSAGRIERLVFTSREAKDIVALLPSPGGKAVLGFQANRATVTGGLLAQYRIVHFATHGLMNDEHPDLSGLLLSLVNEAGQTEDGFLQLHDIYNLNLPVDMVVLSACETGLGKKVRGEGLIGLTRGFMYAGARRVVASLWQVSDPSTSKLMKYFYQAMLKEGMPPAAALRAAQLKMLKQPERQSPYYWAAFELHGDWQVQP